MLIEAPLFALACGGVSFYSDPMFTAIKKIGFGYLVFGLGFFAGIAFTGVLLGMYGYKLDAKAMPSAMAAVQLR